MKKKRVAIIVCFLGILQASEKDPLAHLTLGTLNLAKNKITHVLAKRKVKQEIEKAIKAATVDNQRQVYDKILSYEAQGLLEENEKAEFLKRLQDTLEPHQKLQESQRLQKRLADQNAVLKKQLDALQTTPSQTIEEAVRYLGTAVPLEIPNIDISALEKTNEGLRETIERLETRIEELLQTIENLRLENDTFAQEIEGEFDKFKKESERSLQECRQELRALSLEKNELEELYNQVLAENIQLSSQNDSLVTQVGQFKKGTPTDSGIVQEMEACESTVDQLNKENESLKEELNRLRQENQKLLNDYDTFVESLKNDYELLTALKKENQEKQALLEHLMEVYTVDQKIIETYKRQLQLFDKPPISAHASLVSNIDEIGANE